MAMECANISFLPAWTAVESKEFETFVVARKLRGRGSVNSSPKQDTKQKLTKITNKKTLQANNKSLTAMEIGVVSTKGINVRCLKSANVSLTVDLDFYFINIF
jgi:hypothetical protein